MAGIFHFKQFTVDQSGCAMKINTDGVLLAALAKADAAKSILDIGTGTGVIALMLAQKFPYAKIDAVEIDKTAAETAGGNFRNSPFAERLTIAHSSFQHYFEQFPARKYELIVSNPPFYINSLESPGQQTNIAKHADESFFKELVAGVSKHLSINGACWVILPVPTAEFVKTSMSRFNLHLQKIITIRSFAESEVHREILVFGSSQTKFNIEDFVIYDIPKEYSDSYKSALKDFFTIF